MVVSIIIPSYQQGEELQNALASIERQTLQCYEIIIIDGGSTDSTKNIITDYAHLPIVFKSEPDKGVYDAMNKGIKLSKGDWLYFMGADDRLCEDILVDLSEWLIRDDIDMLYGDVELTSDGSLYNGAFDLEKLLYKGNICHQAIFYRRRIFEFLGGYNLIYKIWGDWDLNIRCFKHPSLSITYVPLKIALYNNVSGTSAQEDEVFKKELPVFYEAELNHLNRQIIFLQHQIAFLNSNSLAIPVNWLKRNLRRLVSKSE